jgi:hypothetical protein
MVKVPALVTAVAVLLGGALLGIVGALIAIPAATALLLLAREVLFPVLTTPEPTAFSTSYITGTCTNTAPRTTWLASGVIGLLSLAASDPGSLIEQRPAGQ